MKEIEIFLQQETIVSAPSKRRKEPLFCEKKYRKRNLEKNSLWENFHQSIVAYLTRLAAHTGSVQVKKKSVRRSYRNMSELWKTKNIVAIDVNHGLRVHKAGNTLFCILPRFCKRERQQKLTKSSEIIWTLLNFHRHSGGKPRTQKLTAFARGDKKT